MRAIGGLGFGASTPSLSRSQLLEASQRGRCPGRRNATGNGRKKRDLGTGRDAFHFCATSCRLRDFVSQDQELAFIRFRPHESRPMFSFPSTFRAAVSCFCLRISVPGNTHWFLSGSPGRDNEARLRRGRTKDAPGHSLQHYRPTARAAIDFASTTATTPAPRPPTPASCKLAADYRLIM
jgi:hypothetical protein